MRNKSSPGMIQTTVLLTPAFNDLRKKHSITLSEAVRVGISIILAERDIMPYDNELNLMRRVNRTRELLEQKSQEYEDLKEKHYKQYGNKENDNQREEQ